MLKLNITDNSKTEVYIEKGFWELLHRSRTDWAMLLGSIFLLIKGGGYWALDSRFRCDHNWYVSQWRTIIIALVSAFVVFKYKKINNAFIVLGGALLGYILMSI